MVLLPALASAQGPEPSRRPVAPSVQECFQALMQAPQQAVQIGTRLAADPALAPADQIAALVCLGHAQHSVGNGDEVEASARRALAIIEDAELDDTEGARATLNVGMLFSSIGENAIAVRLLEQSHAHAVRENVIHARNAALAALGVLYATGFQDLEASEARFREALDLAASNNVQDPIAMYLLGFTLTKQGRFLEARPVLASALELAQRHGLQPGIRRIHTALAEVDRNQGSVEAARTALLESIQWQQQFPDRNGEVESRLRLATLLLENAADPEQARLQAQTALDLATTGRFVPEQRSALDLLYRIYNEQGKSSEAIAMLERRHALDVDVLKRQNVDGVAAIQASMEDMQQKIAAARAIQVRDMGFIATAIALLLGGAVVALSLRHGRRLRRLSTTDPLTRLANRHQIEARLGDWQEQLSRGHGQPGVLMVLDVDEFKQFNDTHGHLPGDDVLRMLSAYLRDSVPAAGMVGRWGGEEFVIALAGTDLAGATELARQLCEGVSRLRIALPSGESAGVTISLGFATYPLIPGDVEEAWIEILRLADRALYAAKLGGRNDYVGLAGTPAGAEVPLDVVLHDPGQAVANGWLLQASGRDVVWT